MSTSRHSRHKARRPRSQRQAAASARRAQMAQRAPLDQSARAAGRKAAVRRQRGFVYIVLCLIAIIVGLVLWLADSGPDIQRSGTPPLGYLREPLGGRSWRVAAWIVGDSRSLDAAIAAKVIDEVDFDWYLSQPDGTVTQTGEQLDLVARASEHKLNLFATVTNRSSATAPFSREVARSILASKESRRRYIDNLAELAQTKGYDGIDLDWEELTRDEREVFSLLIEEAAHELHANHLFLSVAVYPKTSEPGRTPGQLSDDYARIGAAADELKIMTYGRSGVWSQAGPQAQLAWLDQVLRFAESRVKAHKIEMGVPFFGFDWGGGRVVAVTGSSAADLVASAPEAPTRDAASAEMVLQYSDASGNGHTVYYPDSRTVAARLQVLRQHHPEIGGIAIWAMGQEGGGFWKAVGRGLTSRR